MQQDIQEENWSDQPHGKCPLNTGIKCTVSTCSHSKDTFLRTNRVRRHEHPRKPSGKNELLKVVSAASFLGRICDNDVNNSESMTKHTAEKHDKAGADKTSDNDEK